MGKFTGRFGRLKKTTEQIIAEFQEEWDAEEYEEEPYEDFEDEYGSDDGPAEDDDGSDPDGGGYADDQEEDMDDEEPGMYSPGLVAEEQGEELDLVQTENDLKEEYESDWPDEDREEEAEPDWPDEEPEEEYESDWPDEDREEEAESDWPDEDREEEYESDWSGEEPEEEAESDWLDEDREEEAESDWPDEDREEEAEPDWPDEEPEEEYESDWPDEDREEEYESDWSGEELEEEAEPDWPDEEPEEEYESDWPSEDREEEAEPDWPEENLEGQYEQEGSGIVREGEYLDGEYEPDWPGENLEVNQSQEWSEGDSEEECGPEYTEEYLPDDTGEESEDEEDEGNRILDRFIIIAGVAVLLMALVTGIAFVVFRMRSSSPEEIREVGAQLAGVDLIGGQGLDAVSNAQQVYAAALLAMATPEPVATPQPQDYEEQEYKPSISVQMNFSSIEKDLKIKFINKETGKLISNVPFSVNIIDPGGTTIMWSDDDMDGIIYKKNLTPGQYRLVMNALTDDKYKSYGLVTAEQKAEVKKEIEYKEVDVSDEVKTESQINVAKEDTKINETVVESYLQDTVAWVESTSTTISYAEVAKSNIPDPMTLAVSGSFVRLSRENQGGEFQTARFAEETEEKPATQFINPSAVKSMAPPAEAPDMEPTDMPTETAPPVEPPATEPPAQPTEPPATEPPAQPTEPPAMEPPVQPTELPATEPPAQPTEPPATEPPVQPTEPPATEPPAQPTEPPALPPTPTPAPVTYVGKIVPESMTLAVGEQFAATVFCEGVTLQTISWTSSDPASVIVDNNGTVTAVAAARQPVLISYSASGVDNMGNVVNGLTASCRVTVSAFDRKLTLDKATELVYAGASISLTAILENGFDTDVLTVESSDTNVARAEISGRNITVTGLGAGTANITVRYGVNDNTVSATCTVTVKQDPRENRTTPLKDRDGNELYVQENNNYRQAFYADYYVFDKFFKKGEAKYTGWQTIGGVVKYFDLNGNVVTGEQVIQGVKYHFASDGALTVGSGTMGIDVSRWNGTIDWNAVKNSGVSYVIIRCGYRGSSQGTLIVDPMFQNNIKGATDVGLKVGVYFFTQAIDKVEAVEEASMVLELIRNYRISYPVFLDVEPSGGRADAISVETRTEVCKAFCQTIQNGGYTAGIYANKTWLTEKIDTSQLGAYKIWLAQYISAPTYTGRYDLWQYKSTGKVSGITGDVDLNLSYLGY